MAIAEPNQRKKKVMGLAVLLRTLLLCAANTKPIHIMATPTAIINMPKLIISPQKIVSYATQRIPARTSPITTAAINASTAASRIFILFAMSAVLVRNAATLAFGVDGVVTVLADEHARLHEEARLATQVTDDAERTLYERHDFSLDDGKC